MKTNYTIKNFAKRVVMILAVGLMAVNVWGDSSYTIEFKDSGTSSDGSIAQTETEDLISSGSSYISNLVSPTKVYNGKSGYGIKMASSSDYGRLTINFSTTGQVKPSKVTIRACRFGSDEGNLNYKINGGSTSSKTLTSSLADYDITMDGSTTLTSLYLSTSKKSSGRIYVKSITVTYPPACDKSVTVSNGESSTNGSITSITTSPVATCSSTASDRQVSIVVTPSTGYVAPTDLSVGTKTGTVTSTKVSRTDNGNGTFTFVYRYNQNDNGSISYNAACVGKQCTVTFDKNGGSDGSNSVTATYGSAMTAITPPTRAHFDFEGYYDSESNNNGTGNKYYNSDGSSAATWNKNTTSNTTLYAKWTEHGFKNYRTVCCTQHNINIAEMTNGSVTSSVEASCEGTNNVTLTIAPAEGYELASLTVGGSIVTGSVSNNQYTFSMPDKDVAVSAAFSLVNYSITYENMEGATNNANNPATYTVNSDAITLGAPMKDGFDFGGWFTDNDLAPEHAAETPAIAAGSTGNKTFYAKWTQAGTHTVTIADYSNGSVSVTYSGMESALTSGSRDIAENTVLTITATPNDGYDGLLTVGGEDFTSGSTHTLVADITIEALFEPKTYTISYKDKDGADYSGSNLASLPTSHTYNTATALVDGVKAGHSFGGWFTDEDCTVSAGSSIAANTIKENITLYAKWEEITMFNVTWKVNGATYTAGTPTASVEDGSKVTTLPTAPMVCDDDLTFMGWTNAAIEGTQVAAPAVLFKTAGTAPAVTSNVTYHAVFAEANQLTATFNAADISNLTENYTNNWTHTATGITFFITAGQRYTKNEPNTFTVTKNSSCGLTSPDGVKIKKVILTVSEDNSTTYIADHVTPGSLATSGTTQTITSVNEEYLYIYANEDYQIRIKNFDVYYTPVSPTYSNYRTLYDASVPTPTLDVASGKYTSDQLVTISNYDGNYMYFYTTNGSTPAADANLDPISPAVAYDSNDGIAITSDCTLKVIAYDLCHNASEVTTATYTIAESLTLAEFVEQKPTTNEKVDLTGAIVMAREDKRLYVQKDAAAMCLYYSAGAPSFVVGKQIANGIVTGHYDADDLEMKVSNAGSPTATVDGVMPTPLVITDDNAETLLVEANMYRYAQMNSVTLDYDNSSYLNAYSANNSYYYDDWFEVLTSKTLPLSTTECSVKGIITPYSVDDVNYFDQLSPILANDISTNATAVLPTISDLGGADAANAVEVAEGKEITITEDANFDAIYQINDGAETAINTSAVVTITNTEAATKVYVKASRDYYADNSVTYYYIANAALTEHMITCATGLAGGSISADKSAAVNGATVTLTPTPNDHYSLTSWTVTYNDGELKTIDVVNNQFEMPSYDVNVTAEFAEDAYATVSFAKGDEAVTGDVPANQKVYVGNNATMPANPFTYAGHNFAGWKYNETTKQAGETYAVTTAGTITFTAQWIANPICTVTLHAKGAEDAVHNVVQGSTLDIPAAADFAGYTFVGWADAAQTEETTNVVTVVNSFTPEVQAQASTKDFYAVYTRQEGTSKYTKVTAAPSNWSGTYLIVYEDGNVAFNGGLETLDATNNTIDVTITDNTIASSETTDAASFTIASITGGYSVHSASGKYIGREKFDNGLDQSSSSSYTNSISYSNGNVDISSSSTTLKFNSASNQNRFRYFKSGQQDIQLYKYSDATVYYTTNPTIKYNVSYDLGEGAWRANEGCDASIVNAGTVYDVVCDDQPVLATKVFEKWQVNDADIELPYTINANTTFTAVYRDAVSYAVNYDKNGGVGNAPAATNVLEAADYTVLANSWFFRSGYTFEGWNTAADGSGAAYAAEATMAMPSENVTLYAQWQVMPANEKEVVIVAKAGDNYYAMGQTLSGKQFNAISVGGVSNGKVILPNNFSPENKTAITWIMRTNDNGATASFYSPANNKYLAHSGTDLALSSAPVTWTWNSESQCYLNNSRTFMYRSTYGFRSYLPSNFGTYSDGVYVTTAFAKQITTADATETSLSLGDNIVVQNGATLTIGNERFINDVVVENGGNLTLNANVSVHDLILHSTLGKGTGTSTSGNAPGSCGQIANGSNITVTGDVYLELELTQDAKASAGWYAFSVPFPVDAMNGVYYGDTKLTNEVGYAIMSHYGELRAKDEYAWKKFRGIMQPGVFYVITVGNTDYKTLRFKKVKDEALVASTSVAVSPFPSQTGSEDDGAWNGIGNPNLQISNLSTSVPKMQFYDHKSNSFIGRSHSVNLVVGSAFFIQYNSSSSVLIPTSTTSNEGYLAPKREQNAVENTMYELELTNVTTGEMEDNLSLTAREDATNEYEIGRDLAKMSMGAAKCAKMWVPAYGTQLCVADFPLVNDKAEYPLTINAPQAGTYSISTVANENATIYLTRNGRAIWNLSMSACELDLAQGLNEGYGLRLVVNAPAVVTGVDQIDAKTGAQKVIIDEHVYILRGGQMYDVNGKMVK